MTALPRVPPGRAGVMWLRDRLAVAQRGRDQLDRKLRVLVGEQGRRRERVRNLEAEWVRRCEDARTWLLRTALLDGEDAARRARPRGGATVRLQWATALGLQYPAAGTLLAPEADPVSRPGPALRAAADAYQAALAAAVELGVAAEAARRFDAEADLVRRRLRALDRRWLPRLQQALDATLLGLEQAEQEDATRIRRAMSSGLSAPRPRGG